MTWDGLLFKHWYCLYAVYRMRKVFLFEPYALMDHVGTHCGNKYFCCPFKPICNEKYTADVLPLIRTWKQSTQAVQGCYYLLYFVGPRWFCNDFEFISSYPTFIYSSNVPKEQPSSQVARSTFLSNPLQTQEGAQLHDQEGAPRPVMPEVILSSHTRENVLPPADVAHEFSCALNASVFNAAFSASQPVLSSCDGGVDATDLLNCSQCMLILLVWED